MPVFLSAIAKLFFFGSLLFLFVCTAFVLFFIRFHKNQSNLKMQKKTMQFRFEEQLLQAQLEVQEQTLKNVSQEIHDNIGQTLSLVKLNLNTMDLEQQEKLQDKILASRQLVGKAIQDLRSLSRSLNQDFIQSAGLVKAIESDLAIIQNAGVYTTQLRLTGQPESIDPKKELILFRIVQEATSNIIRHANATAIEVVMDFAVNQLTIEIKDNGQGFDANTVAQGSGLRNMRSRAQMIGGNLVIQSTGDGTCLTITVPTTEL
jgi:two-component system NarL family sensor kinase